jgi:DNA-binding transcriptional regulator YiaG
MRSGRLFHYVRCGLDNVWLANGYRIEKTAYGRAVAIDKADELHHAIALALVSSPWPLRGQDARFLRVMLDLSQEDMARLLGVDRATVIRWEKSRDKPLSRMQDIAVRATYDARSASGIFLRSVIRELQEADERRHGASHRSIFESRRSGWQRKAA